MRLGVMQGRLAPPVDNQIQAFPLAAWREEFPASQRLGLTCLEWIFERPRFAENPLWSDAGVAELKALAARHGVAVNALALGYFRTELTEALRADPARTQGILARTPAGRWGEPDDLAGAAVFLASPACAYVHGALLSVDGGWLAW